MRTWKTTSDGGLESSSVVEITFTGEPTLAGEF
jgi:hypothetical protein